MDSKILKGLVAIISILGIVGFIMVARAGEGTPEMASAASFMVSIAFYLLIVVVVVTVLLSLISLLKNPAALKKTFVGLAILAVVLAVSYFTASDAAVYDAQGVVLKEGQAGATSKWVGTGITYSLLLGFVGLVFFVLDLLKGLVKS
ncbi:hypothetical protein V3A08_07130 [Tenacibaculum maritimum]|uniref:hypothetical protein n=1 Tax=Tenacibaculum maritimum TaxID=107401 RepID=UPI0012E45DC9|nr:hypothetical protein [Tenacibaculum maritimum]MDB0600449.1 hypothetical protein [Tenacibaculum maritimum]MDB0610603.1 hypothetical protein [Tenacibaculum maritimum]CAA0161771.1 conserved membrane hypothetical protein [Tenacibaculum maritimum]